MVAYLSMDFLKVHLFLFIWLSQVLVAACGIQFPYQGLSPGPLHWECRVLTTGPQTKSLNHRFLINSLMDYLL